MDRVLTPVSRGGVMVITLAWNARSQGSNPALSRCNISHFRQSHDTKLKSKSAPMKLVFGVLTIFATITLFGKYSNFFPNNRYQSFPLIIENGQLILRKRTIGNYISTLTWSGLETSDDNSITPLNPSAPPFPASNVVCAD